VFRRLLHLREVDEPIAGRAEGCTNSFPCCLLIVYRCTRGCYEGVRSHCYSPPHVVHLLS